VKNVVKLAALGAFAGAAILFLINVYDLLTGESDFPGQP